jgi:hypothetical protein
VPRCINRRVSFMAILLKNRVLLPIRNTQLRKRIVGKRWRERGD